MAWQLLLTIYLLLNTVSYLLQRRLGQTLAEHKRLVSAFFFLVIHYPMGLIVAIYSSPDLSIGWLNLWFLLVGSWAFPAVNVLSLKASKNVDAGYFTILSNLTPIVTIVAATMLLNESLNNQQLFGAAIIIAAALLITLPKLQHHRKSRASGLVVALICFLLAGLATVYERWMLTRIGFGSYLIFGWGFQTLWMAIIAWPEREYLKIVKIKRHFVPILGYALSGSVKGICFVAALKLSGNASLVSAFSSFTAIMVVSAAYFVLKEKDWLWLKFGAAAMGTAGLIILNLNQ
jgi:drug/metabolite transporter (DMT)-like permease